MKFVHKALGLVLASVALCSCGGGGGDGNSFTSPPQPGSITLAAWPSSASVMATGRAVSPTPSTTIRRLMRQPSLTRRP